MVTAVFGVSVLYEDLTLCLCKVYAGEDPATRQRRREVLYMRNWVLIRKGDAVDCFVVSIWSLVAIGHRGHMKGRGPGTTGRSDYVQFQHLVEFCLGSAELSGASRQGD